VAHFRTATNKLKGTSDRCGTRLKRYWCLGINEIMEKDVVLQLPNEMLRLRKGQGDLEIYLTWHSDTLIYLIDRIKLA